MRALTAESSARSSRLPASMRVLSVQMAGLRSDHAEFRTDVRRLDDRLRAVEVELMAFPDSILRAGIASRRRRRLQQQLTHADHVPSVNRRVGRAVVVRQPPAGAGPQSRRRRSGHRRGARGLPSGRLVTQGLLEPDPHSSDVPGSAEPSSNSAAG